MEHIQENSDNSDSSVSLSPSKSNNNLFTFEDRSNQKSKAKIKAEAQDLAFLKVLRELTTHIISQQILKISNKLNLENKSSNKNTLKPKNTSSKHTILQENSQKISKSIQERKEITKELSISEQFAKIEYQLNPFKLPPSTSSTKFRSKSKNSNEIVGINDSKTKESQDENNLIKSLNISIDERINTADCKLPNSRNAISRFTRTLDNPVCSILQKKRINRSVQESFRPLSVFNSNIGKNNRTDEISSYLNPTPITSVIISEHFETPKISIRKRLRRRFRFGHFISKDANLRESIRLKRRADYFLENIHQQKPPNILAYSQEGLEKIINSQKDRKYVTAVSSIKKYGELKKSLLVGSFFNKLKS